MLLHAFQYALQKNGSNCQDDTAIFEFGVAGGTTYMQLANEILRRKLKTKLVGFDSFEGLPHEDPNVWRPDWHAKGEHAFTIDHVLHKMHDAGIDQNPQFDVVAGFYEDSLKTDHAIELRSKIKHLMLVNIDVDLYISTMQLLDYCLPVMGRGTVLYFDDWKDPRYTQTEPWGEHRAWDEWTQAHPNVMWQTIRVGANNERYVEISGV